MVAFELLDLLNKHKIATYVGVEDLADKLNFLYTVTVLIILTIIVTAKSYVFEPLSCYTPTVASGENANSYMKSYCWVHGTIPLSKLESMPDTEDDWNYMDKSRRINYYQWVPFMLGLQCILFYTPRLIWQLVCSHRMGTDLELLISSANEAVHAEDDQSRDKVIDNAADNLEAMLMTNRDRRTGRLANMRRKLHHTCSLCMVSKRLGTWLVVVYLAIKVLYFANACGQLFLVKVFLGFDGGLFAFGNKLMDQMFAGAEWNETLIFPRTSWCSVKLRHLGVNSNRYVSQCTLPINMLNEKIYIFLWFWIALVALITLFSIPTWFLRMGVRKNRSQFLKKFLRMADSYDKRSDKSVAFDFMEEFLRQDGVFLLRMMSLNAGDLVTSQVVGKLWQSYRVNHQVKS